MEGTKVGKNEGEENEMEAGVTIAGRGGKKGSSAFALPGEGRGEGKKMI